jgi:hypothetical protein
MSVINELMKYPIQINIAMGECSGSVFITFNWEQVIREASLLEGKMVIFKFKEHVENGLRVSVFRYPNS